MTEFVNVQHQTVVRQVTYKAPEPMGEHYIAESFDRGTLDG